MRNLVCTHLLNRYDKSVHRQKTLGRNWARKDDGVDVREPRGDDSLRGKGRCAGRRSGESKLTWAGQIFGT